MSVSSALPTASIIESASNRFASNRANISADLDSARHRRAMARRLEQLNAALGETQPPAPAFCAEVVQQPSAIATQPGKTTDVGALFVTGLLSALLGAGFMWLALQPETHIPFAPAPMTATASHAPDIQPPMPVAKQISDQAEVEALLENWRNAWMQRDIVGYLKAYSTQFTPADGNSRTAWVAGRTKKLAAGAPIDVQVRKLAVEQLDTDRYQATFLQDYASGAYREMGRAKTLLLVRENGQWRISGEWMADQKPAAR